jgi:hypothetical protein
LAPVRSTRLAKVAERLPKYRPAVEVGRGTDEYSSQANRDM